MTLTKVYDVTLKTLLENFHMAQNAFGCGFSKFLEYFCFVLFFCDFGCTIFGSFYRWSTRSVTMDPREVFFMNMGGNHSDVEPT